MTYSINTLFNYTVNGIDVTKLLCTFVNDEDITKRVIVEVFNGDETRVNILSEESDELSNEDRNLFYYLLDRWFINNFLL
jgi:hypothetical protein